MPQSQKSIPYIGVSAPLPCGRCDCSPCLPTEAHKRARNSALRVEPRLSQSHRALDPIQFAPGPIFRIGPGLSQVFYFLFCLSVCVCVGGVCVCTFCFFFRLCFVCVFVCFCCACVLFRTFVVFSSDDRPAITRLSLSDLACAVTSQEP